MSRDDTRSRPTFPESARGPLERDLRRAVRGAVRFDDGARALYATDASNYRQVPIGVVEPLDRDDVAAAVDVARRHAAPVLARGGGTSLAGQCCNEAVVLDFTPHVNRVLEIDPARRRARVEPGCVLDELQKRAAPHGLRFGPDPATHTHCTLGGMIGNNSCGVHSVTAGRTADNVESLEVLTYDGLRLRVGATPPEELERRKSAPGREGAIYRALEELSRAYGPLVRERFPRIPRRVSGYNLDELLPENGFHVARALVGSESTCVTVLEATLRLVPRPARRVLLVLGYPDIYQAGDHVMEVLAGGPIGLEAIDDRLVHYMKIKGLHVHDLTMLPPGQGWLLAEFGGDTAEEAHARAKRVADRLHGRKAPSQKLIDREEEQHRLWEVREAGLGATALLPTMPDTWPGWEDAAVPPERLGGYLRDFRALLNSFGYHCALYGHFGQGCVHLRIDFDLLTRAGLDNYLEFTRRAAELVVRYGGSLSGEHGDGQARGPLLPLMFGDELMRAFARFKAIWDPEGRMNPGKAAVSPAPQDAHLRLGTTYRPPVVNTRFEFGDDHHDFARATMRCVGVGECRRHEGGTMCPSYRVTREEQHSTRGRARLLFEMLEGDPLRGGWRSEAVHDALHLCLACKGCKSDCPVSVDMATYKAEFLSHYYQGRLRPRAAYAFGLIDTWSRLAEIAPWAVNAVTRTPGLAAVAKWLAGIAPQRTVPAFAPVTFRRRFRERARRGAGDAPPRTRVLLWPDTFNDHFFPEVLLAATEVLERLGCEVVIPDRPVCCGRPLYDFGMLDRARGRLLAVLDALRPELDRGTPVVGIEPSCVAVFRDELTAILPHDRDATRLRHQAFTFAEFLRTRLQPGAYRSGRRAIVHGHCHQKAIMKMEADEAVLKALGIDYRLLDSGCCGMAGSFGFERGDRYEVSVRCGELVLLPAVRAADPETWILADGFSCREQIAQLTGRRAMHLAEAVLQVMRETPGPEPGARRPRLEQTTETRRRAAHEGATRRPPGR